VKAHRRFTAIAAAGLLAAGVAACSSSSSSTSGTPGSAHSSGGTASTLVMESSPESSITQAFNPFAATEAAWGMGATGLIYEPLIQFDLASPTVHYPWLATSYTWSNGGMQNYTGWPTQSNPYDSGQPSGTNNGPGSGSDEVVILHLRPR
jgi:ABC-type transport system substrate-binding protein